MRQNKEVINCDRCKIEIEDHEKVYHGVSWNGDVKEHSYDLAFAKHHNLGDLCPKCYCIVLLKYRDWVLKTNKLTLKDLENYPPKKIEKEMD